MKPYYEQDGIVIFHGDCLDVLPTLEAVDHVITDPPYARDVYVRLGAPNTKTGSGTPARLLGSQYSSVKQRERGIKRAGLGTAAAMSIAKLAAGDIGAIDEMIEPISAEIARLTKRWAIVYSDVESTHIWRAQLERGGMRYVRTGAWVKPDPMPQMSGDRPATGFEPCTITHAQGAMRWNGGGHAAVWTHNTAKGNDRPDHPCPKPIALMREQIEQFTDRGDVILDPFMGSGTTLRAAKDLGRRAIGIEVNEDYCRAAVERLRQSVLAL